MCHSIPYFSPMIPNPLSGWIPYKLLRNEEQAVCRWLHIGDTPFTEPFFADTISQCQVNNSRQFHVTGNLELLPGWAATLPSIAPTAFIFHISRCGSTLLSQLLGINPANIVLSEVPFLDDILRTPYRQENIDVSTMLPAAVQFYAQKRSGIEKHLFIKTDSWHVCFYQLLRQLYPDTPFILLYRNPQEVLRSQQKKRGMHAVPGVVESAVFGFDDAPVSDLDAYFAKVMERYLSLFKEISEKDDNSLLVNYNHGMLNVAMQVAAFTKLAISPEEHKKMETRCQFNAKYPGEVFSETQSKQDVPAYLQHCMKLYVELNGHASH